LNNFCNRHYLEQQSALINNFCNRHYLEQQSALIFSLRLNQIRKKKYDAAVDAADDDDDDDDEDEDDDDLHATPYQSDSHCL